MGSGLRQLRAIVLLVTVLLLAGQTYGRTWWDTDWSCRRQVEVGHYERTELPGDDIAVVTMPITDAVQDDGADIRVVTGDGTVVPHRVLQMGPGDQIRIAFAPKDTDRNHYVYWGNPDAHAPDETLEFQRGILQEMWAYPGGNFNTFESAQDVLNNATDPIGAGFRPSVFQGFNPFGDQQATVSTFTGFFEVPVEGEYTFAISSQNGSFLTIDGELLLSNGGRHAPQQDASIQKSITLKKGLHEFQFIHISPSGDPVVVLAWQPPGGKRIWPMMANDFTSVTRAIPGSIEHRDQDATIDFRTDHAGEAYASNRYFQRYEFHATTDGFAGRDLQWEWDFGDGITAYGKDVSHVYLADGEYTVRLTANTRLGVQTREYRLAVERPWEYVIRETIDPVDTHVDIVSQYSLSAMPPLSVAGAVLLFDGAQQDALTTHAGREYVSRDRLPGYVTISTMSVLTERSVADGNVQAAIDNLVEAAGKVDVPRAGAILYLRAAELTLQRHADADTAETILDLAAPGLSEADGPRIRALRRFRGDVCRLRAELEDARAYYTDAEPERSGLPGHRAMLEGDFARHVESYLRENEYVLAQEKLDAWTEELPECKLDGYWSLLQVKLYMLEGNNELAGMEAETLVGVNPESNYGAELLMLAANAYSRLDDRDRTIGALKQIIALYPESDYATRARELLGE
jgi:hypothetical protein